MNTTSDSVRIVIFNKAEPKLFLVLTEADDINNWKLPGGKFNSINETPDAAALRELKEELQIEANDIELSKINQLVNDDGVSARYIYKAVADASEVCPSSEIARINWVTQDSVPDGRNKNHILSAIQLAQKTK